MAPVHKIAVIQLHPKPLDCAGNFGRAAAFIRDAASKGAHLAVLPEYHLTGWAPDDDNFVAACGQWREYLAKYQALARELNINIVPGTIMEHHPGGDGESDDDVLMNVAYFIQAGDGEVLGRYQKKNLWHPERPHLTSSGHDPHEVFDTPLGKVGMLICWDLAFPEAFRELVGQGAQLVIVPTFWTLNDCSPYGLALNRQAEALFLQSTLVSRAFENTCAVIFANAGEDPAVTAKAASKAKLSRENGITDAPSAENSKNNGTTNSGAAGGATGPLDSEGEGYFAGLSQVALPFVGGLGDATRSSAAEAMSVVEVDMALLREAEAQYRVRADMARDDWHYLYRHSSKEG